MVYVPQEISHTGVCANKVKVVAAMSKSMEQENIVCIYICIYILLIKVFPKLGLLPRQKHVITTMGG